MLGSMIVSMVLLGSASGLEDLDSSKTAEWNGIRIESRATGGTVQFSESAGEFEIRMDFGQIFHSVLVGPETILVASNALGSEGKMSLEVEGCRGISVTGTRDTFLLKAVEWHSSNSSSRSSGSTSTDSSSKSQSSSSISTSVSTNVKALGFAAWNGKSVQLTLEGGDSIESTFERNANRLVVGFNIDRGKNKRTITLEPGSIEIDGKERHQGDYSRLLVAATKSSLAVETDRDVIGTWKGDMQKPVLPD